jgi:hypothetical protein
MPMHDWSLVKPGTYHNFHVLWMVAILDRLNAGLLPADYYALAERLIGQQETDVVLAIPKDRERYVRKANRVVIRHGLEEVVAVIAIVSPGNKDREHSLRAFVDKAVDLMVQQVNLLIIDPFRPGEHDPQGVHKAIWDELTDEPFALPPDKPLTVAAYQAAPMSIAYVEPIAVGDPLPDMPLFLFEASYITVPLEETYQGTWNVLPVQLRELLDPPAA